MALVPHDSIEFILTDPRAGEETTTTTTTTQANKQNKQHTHTAWEKLKRQVSGRDPPTLLQSHHVTFCRNVK